MWFIVLLVVDALVCMGLAYKLAERKGFHHNTGLWAVAGFLFGPVGLIAAAGLPDYSTEADKEKYRHPSQEPVNDAPCGICCPVCGGEAGSCSCSTKPDLSRKLWHCRCGEVNISSMTNCKACHRARVQCEKSSEEK
jgi:hypothetical protein